MTTILALDASTDACSVALANAVDTASIFEVIPREHNHRLFSMLRELLPDGAAAAGINTLAFGQGPGSFTGLRVAASAAQGLAYTLGVPAVGISTLACIAQGGLRRGVLNAADTAMVVLDARINEIYAGLYRFENGLAVPCTADCVIAPSELSAEYLAGQQTVVALGTGINCLEECPARVQAAITRTLDAQWPDSVDLVPLARQAIARGELLAPEQVQPVYLRNEVNWKKLSEQGRGRG